MTAQVLILGGTGMLGFSMLQVLSARGVPVRATTRNINIVPSEFRSRFTQYEATAPLDDLVRDLGPDDFVVNCVGVLKSYIKNDSSVDRLRAIEVNAQFPYRLAEKGAELGFRTIQIGTDCVYDGVAGSYDESALHNATDVYGQTKSLGEVPAERFLNLRSSIIGPEIQNKGSLLEWVLSHAAGSAFNGYVDHIWNGVTSRAFARVAAGIIESGNDLSGTYHLVPADVVNKYELSRVILEAFKRTEVAVAPVRTANPIDRSISTMYPDENKRLWSDAGYSAIPSISQMVDEVAATTPALIGDEV